MDTIEGPHKKHTIEDQCCSWATPLKNCLNAVFKWCLNKASYIFLYVQKHAASIH